MRLQAEILLDTVDLFPCQEVLISLLSAKHLFPATRHQYFVTL